MKQLIKNLTVSLLLGANICTILLMWLCILLTYVSPEQLPRLSLLTLAFPVFLAANVLFTIFWLLFQARLAWVPIAAMLLIGPFILDYTPINPAASTTTEDDDSTLTVLTYNVGQMRDEEQQEEFIRLVNLTHPDIVCLQEFGRRFIDKHKDWYQSTGYHDMQLANVAIITRLPIISDSIPIHYPTRSNHSIACWLDYQGDSLLIINNHLESNHLSPEEKDDYTHTITDPNRQAIKNSSRKLLDKLSEAAAYRGPQTDSICTLIDQHSGQHIIVCGDLNETPISYTYQRLARRLLSAHRQKGNGPGFTYTRRSFPVHIDHIFHSNHWTCTSCRIDRTVSSSDHYPFIARLSKKVR